MKINDRCRLICIDKDFQLRNGKYIGKFRVRSLVVSAGPLAFEEQRGCISTLGASIQAAARLLGFTRILSSGILNTNWL